MTKPLRLKPQAKAGRSFDIGAFKGALLGSLGKLLLLTIAPGVFLIACRDEHVPAPQQPSLATVDVRDSVYIVSQKLYLWNEYLPALTDFKPANYDSPQAVMHEIRKYSPLNSRGSGPLDRWSFVVRKADWENAVQGISGNFGCGFFFLEADDMRVAWVQSNSSAGIKGLSRGLKVLSINGIPAVTNNAELLFKALLDNAEIGVEIEKLDKTRTHVVLNKTQYQANAVLKKRIIEIEGYTIGYIAFSTFIEGAVQELTEAFLYFKQHNVDELVVDLRYNGGGLVSVAEYFANLIAPANARGKIMYMDKHNPQYAIFNAKKYFNTINSPLTINRVYFISSGFTASASELLINCLKPYMDVRVVGQPSNGKPVGMYPIPVMDYMVTPVSYQLLNANGEGDYFEGIMPDISQIDDLTRDFGDPEELCLKEILNLLQAKREQAGGRIAASKAATACLAANRVLAGQTLMGAFKLNKGLMK